MFIRRANVALDKWWAESDELHGTSSTFASEREPHADDQAPGFGFGVAEQTMDEHALLRRLLLGDLHYAKLWLICAALRGAAWDRLPFEQRELAFQAKDAAAACLSTVLDSPAYRAALRYAVHDALAPVAFAALFLLKLASLFPGEVEVPALVGQVEQLAGLLSDVAAER